MYVRIRLRNRINFRRREIKPKSNQIYFIRNYIHTWRRREKKHHEDYNDNKIKIIWWYNNEKEFNNNNKNEKEMKWISNII